MHVRKTICLLTAAALAACMLTGCPWEEDPAASSSGPSSGTSGASGASGGEDADDPAAPSSSSSSSSQPETPATYTISVTAGGCTCAGAEINDGKITVQEGGTVTLTFTPTDKKTGLDGVKVNGQEVANIQKGSASYTHTFEDVQKDQSIAVTFSDLGYVVETDKDNKPTCKGHDETGLLAWAEAANTKLDTNCTLTANISIEDWKQVGDWDVGYTGTFDGNGKTITGLDVDESDAAMFGAIGVGGKVQNLTLENVDIDGSGRVGGIAVYNYGEIENCTVKGELTANAGTAVGGIVAHNSNPIAGTIAGTITNCHFEGTITNELANVQPTTRYIGGIAGMKSNGEICGNCTCHYTYVIERYNFTTGKYEYTIYEDRNNLTGRGEEH